MTDIDQDVKHGRILDEGMKHLTNDKVRLEDLKKLAEESDTLIQRLVKIVLTELLKNVKDVREDSRVRLTTITKETVLIEFNGPILQFSLENFLFLLYKYNINRLFMSIDYLISII